VNDITIDFTPVVRTIERNMEVLSRQVSDVSSDVGLVSARVDATRTDLQELRDMFEQFLERNERNRLVQLAETRLGGLKAELDREFGHYAVVRRTSVGILQAFDVGNVRVKTMHEISEELMIQTPRYWLAPALVGLAAWSKDDQELASKSIEAAFSRDPKKTSLFFALVLRRQNRLDEARRWLNHYFTALDPRGLTREFAVLLEATSQDGFGEVGRALVGTHLARWSELLRDEDEVVEQQISKWLTELANSRGTVNPKDFEYLSACSPDWKAIEAGLEAASAHAFVLDKYTAVRDAPTHLSASIADRLDDLLDILVTEYDAEELPLRREVLVQEAIIAHDGDADRAQQQADSDIAALDEKVDALSLQTHTALRPDLFGVSTATQRVSVGASKPDVTAAIGRFARDYRAAWPATVTVALEPHHTQHAQTYGFSRWSITSDVDEATAEQQLSEHWDSTMSAYIDAQRFTPGKAAMPVIVGLGAALFGLLFVQVAVGFTIIMVLAGLAFAAGMIFKRVKDAEKRVAQAEEIRETAKQHSRDMYRATIAEWLDARLAYQEQDAKERDLLALVEGWPA